MKKLLLLAMAACVALASGTASLYAATASSETVTADAVMTMTDKTKKTVKVPLVRKGDVQYFKLAKETIPANIDTIEIVHPWAVAQAGDDGFFVLANGMYGTFRPGQKGQYSNNNTIMQMIGVKTPKAAMTMILTGLNYEARHVVTCNGNEYTVFPRYMLNRIPLYEDLTIEFHLLDRARATYADMAHVYREYQASRGEIVPIRERAKTNPELAYAANAPEVRVRLAWKPVPSPVGEQTAETEPPMKVAISFDRFMDIVDEFKRQGIDKAEFCLVGWNIGGHDGRYPQIFPVDARLGGEKKLKEAIAKTQKDGYLVVCHTNNSDAYSSSSIGGLWDENFLQIDADGKTITRTTWGGGNMYNTCPKCMFERFVPGDYTRLKALGFRGLHYVDVFSTINPRTCYSKEHPLSKRGYAEWTNRIGALARKEFGGFASEGGFDYCIRNLDYALYISFSNPLVKTPNLVERIVPIWQLVYNGYVLNNPFTATMNYTIKDSKTALKLMEFGGRPSFYFYSKFKSSGSNWMGDADIACATQDELRDSVANIKRGYEQFKQVRDLQLEFMESHDQIADGVFVTGFSNGTRIVTNYNDTPYDYKGKTVAPVGYLVIAK